MYPAPLPGGGVATVGEGMDINVSDAIDLGLTQDAIEVLEHAMHAGIGNNTHEMEPGSAGLHPFHRGPPDLVRFQLLFGKEFVQPDQFLIHNATGADVLVAHLAVPHHSVGQTDIEAGRRHQGVRVLCMEAVVRLFLSQVHGIERVLLGMGVLAPTIANDQ
jgi:hypothetical protein